MEAATNARTGILLINLGTPDAPRAPEVRRYLREFLSDPLVIDIAPLARSLLVHGIIAPFRAPKAAEAYRKVWTERGSPLLVHSLDLRDAVRERLEGMPVELAMRYGTPSIAAGLDSLASEGCEHVLAAPLYPHYALSSTESSLVKVREETAARGMTLDSLAPFYEDMRFLDAFAAIGKPVLETLQPDHVLFSYHGLPERHCTKTDPTGAHCLQRDDCCASIVDANRDCYRAQCFATTCGLRARLGLDETNSSISFQSRLGRTPWIRPYTDEVIVQLAERGVKRVAVYCPAFVADCLETLEEIGIRARASFTEAGGERLELVPSLNATQVWVEGLCEMLAERLPQGAATG